MSGAEPLVPIIKPGTFRTRGGELVRFEETGGGLPLFRGAARDGISCWYPNGAYIREGSLSERDIVEYLGLGPVPAGPPGFYAKQDGATAAPTTAPGTKHSHYFKPCPYDHVDVYRVLLMFNVTDPCVQHAVKKLLAAGARGAKDVGRDVQEAIDSLERWKAMRAEEAR